MREKGFFDTFVEKTNPALRVLEEAYDKVVFLFPNKNFEELARKLLVSPDITPFHIEEAIEYINRKKQEIKKEIRAKYFRALMVAIVIIFVGVSLGLIASLVYNIIVGVFLSSLIVLVLSLFILGDSLSLERSPYDEYELGKLETFERLLKALKQPKSNS